MISKATLQKEISVLVYHSVDLNNAFHTVHPKEFEKQMEYLRKNYSVVSLDDMVDFVKGRKNLPEKAVAVTFDDGFYDNYSNVYPYFRKYKLPAAIFLITGYCGRETCLDDVPLKMLSWNEIREMSQNDIGIGAHTITHPNLQETNLEEAKKEILGSKEEIEKKTGENVYYFAYPFDRYRNEIIDLVRISGFKGAFDGNGSIRKGANPFLLNRISIDSSITFMMFKTRLTRAVDWYRKTEQIAKTMLNRFQFISIINRVYNNTELARRCAQAS